MANSKNVWTEQEDEFIESNYMGYATVPMIAEKLGRTETSVLRRLRVLILPTTLQKVSQTRASCDKHTEDLISSGGRWT